MITKEVFGVTKRGESVEAYTLSDEYGSATVLTYGGTIQSLRVQDKNGKLTDVVLGYDTLREYEENCCLFGAIVGRFANRIKGGRLPLDGKVVQLPVNEKGNHIHGGFVGFHHRVWTASVENDCLVLSYRSPDGEEGYPGNLNVAARFSFRLGVLTIAFDAVSDATTAINLIHHDYFNLNGAGEGDILDTSLWLDADRVAITDDTLVPVELIDVTGTPFDFRKTKRIGADIFADDQALRKADGYDHCYVINKKGAGLQPYARAVGEKTGIVLTGRTDYPAVQLYTANGIRQTGKGKKFGSYSAFCLETSLIPNNVNHPEFAKIGSSVLRAGEHFHFTTQFQFEVQSI